MSKQFDTTPDVVYAATLTQAGTVHAVMEDGTLAFLVESSGAGQVQFQAISGKVEISDDDVRAVRPFPKAPASGLGGGGGAGGAALAAHVNNADVHLTPTERVYLNSLTTQPTLPDGALSWHEISYHFSLAAQPGDENVQAATSAPAAVYAVRVPLAYTDANGTWQNKSSILDETATGLLRKLFDNAGLVSEQSTDLVVGRDDYAGRWAFYWQHANYITDSHGVKHITAVRGVHRAFNPYKENVAAFGTAFYFFCKEERSLQNGVWTTDDGTETGKAKYQVWGITSRPWGELPADKRAELESIGVGESDLTLWPECLVLDDGGNEVVRPYWAHSAYCGGAEKQKDGTYQMVSKKDLPLFNGLSHNSLNALHGNKAGFGGSALVQAFGILFDVLKTGNKNSQAIHKGNTGNYNNTVAATHDTLEAGYIWPVASQGQFIAGGTVQLLQASGSTWSMTYKLSTATQQPRIAAIETREFTALDGSTVSSLCLVFDPDTCQPFKVRVAAADAKALSGAGEYAHSFAVQGMARTGETDVVPYPHDGSMTSNTDGKHPYRTMGTEFLPGIWMIAADVVAIKGTGAVDVTIDSASFTPASTDYVVLHAGFGVARKTSGTLQQFLDGGYEAVGIMPTTAGWILNVQLTKEGVVYPTAIGDGNSLGHADYFYTGASPAEFLVGGSATNGSYAGSASVHVSNALSNSSAHVGGRD